MKHDKTCLKITKSGLINSNIKKIMLIIALALLLSSCSTTPSIIPNPPESYHPTIPTTDKELIEEWQRALMKIKEWQVWYDIQNF